MIDSYLWGTVDRMSPEAPVPVVSVKNREKRLGGAANVALNLKALGCKPIVISVIGDDQDGKDLVKLFIENGLSTEGLIQTKDRVTTIKHRIISDKHLLRVDSEQTDDLNPELEKQFLEKVELLGLNSKCIVFQDYNKGVLTKKVIEKGIDFAQSHKIPTTVDPKKKNFETYKGVSLFKPNLKEINEALGTNVKGDDIDAIAKVGQEFIIKNNIDAALITLSENGAIIISKEKYIHQKAHKRTIVDVSGAGDTVISVASAFLALGLDSEQLLTYSNLSGGLVCESIGVVPIDKVQLMNESIALFSTL